jgi:hypothetical protein
LGRVAETIGQEELEKQAGGAIPSPTSFFRGELAGELVFAELFEAVAETALQRRRSIGIERDEIPERLAAVFAEPSKRTGIGARMACNIFTSDTVNQELDLKIY